MRSIRERLQSMEPGTRESKRELPPGVPIEAIAPGTERVTERGAHFLVEALIPDPTSGMFEAWIPTLPTLLDPSLRTNIETRPGDVLFLDTETTGLDRGTGTHVFLVGVGYFDTAGFRVQQYFIRDLYEEASLLEDLRELISEFSLLVTFNGRAFDWPLLYTRFILHGYRDIPELPHWDLLTASRRVWRQRLRDCSLGNLERQILGVERAGDVPGYLIPQLYFDYLRDRDASLLRPVFRHNQEDIVSLARLAECLLGAEAEPHARLVHAEDQISYGLHLLSRGDNSRAAALIRPALNDSLLSSDLRFRGAQSLATAFKRQEDWDSAVEIWEEMTAQPSRDPWHRLYPLVELAKAYEHRLPDIDAALNYTQRALNMVDLNGWHSYRDEIAHRLARLSRKRAEYKGKTAIGTHLWGPE